MSNRFRSERIRPDFEEIFTEVVVLLAEGGFVKRGTYFLDGTKVEANANKFTFVWKKSTDRYQEALRQKVRARLSAVDEMEDGEDALAPEDAAAIDSDAIAKAARRINDRLKKKLDDKGLRETKKDLEKDFLPRMRKYEHQQDAFAGRNSFSKTIRTPPSCG